VIVLPKVVGLGTCAVDNVLTVPFLPAADESAPILSVKRYGGGVVANCLVGLSRLGVKTGYLGKFGCDENGLFAMKELEKEGVDTSHVLFAENEQSLHTYILVDERGSRTILYYPGALFTMSSDEVDQTYIKNASLLHTDCMPPSVVWECVKAAKKEGVTISVDLSFRPRRFGRIFFGTQEIIERIIRLADIFIPCRAAAFELTEKSDYEEILLDLLDFGPKIVGVTLGSEGCMFATDKGIVRKAPFKIEVLDTTGAGDAFHAGFLYGFLKGWNIEKSAEFANLVASLKCRKPGPRDGLPTITEAMDFWKRTKETII